jgi:hypothetical protein
MATPDWQAIPCKIASLGLIVEQYTRVSPLSGIPPSGDETRGYAAFFTIQNTYT